MGIKESKSITDLQQKLRSMKADFTDLYSKIRAPEYRRKLRNWLRNLRSSLAQIDSEESRQEVLELAGRMITFFDEMARKGRTELDDFAKNYREFYQDLSFFDPTGQETGERDKSDDETLQLLRKHLKDLIPPEQIK